MVITRKIEVIVNEQDPKKRKEYMSLIYKWRNLVRRAANIAISHKCVQKNLAEFDYLTDEIKDKMEVTRKKDVSDIIKKGPGLSVQNITYRKMVEAFGDDIKHAVLACLNQAVSKSFNKTYPLVQKGETSLRTYKNDIPIPFPATGITNLKEVEIEGEDDCSTKSKKTNKYFTFTLFGIPFKTIMGHRDRSRNSFILNEIIKYQKLDSQNSCDGESSEALDSNEQQVSKYELKTSSLTIDERKGGNKMFILLCVDIPDQPIKTKKEKILYAYLSVNTPIICSSNPSAITIMSNSGMYEQRQNMMELARQLENLDKGVGEETRKSIEKLYSDSKGKNPYIISIGSKEEYLYRRIQIQRAVRRCQKSNRYAKGGKGREMKCQALERWHNIERNYIDTKLHTYARKLVQEAIKQDCSTILLCNQEWQEQEAKSAHKRGDCFLLRNWSYYGLKDKIQYKAKQVGIKVQSEEPPKSIVVYFGNDEYKTLKKFSDTIHGKVYKITTPEAKVQDIDTYDIVYIGFSGLDHDIPHIIEAFITNNVLPKHLVVPYTTLATGDLPQTVTNIKSSFNSLSWVDGVNLCGLSKKEMNAIGKSVSNLQETSY